MKLVNMQKHFVSSVIVNRSPFESLHLMLMIPAKSPSFPAD
jgi:hypothetical protein